MKYRLIEKEIESLEIDAPRVSPSINVGGAGADSVVFVLNVTGVDTPGTANITLQGSIDDTSFVNVGSAVDVTATGALVLEEDHPVFNHYRVSYAIASGAFTATLKVLAKGDKGE